MYERILSLYCSGRLTDAGIDRAVNLGWITEEQKLEIVTQKTSE